MPRTIRTGCEASRRHNMPILPYIDCPEHLTNLDSWGALCYCAAIPACVLLLLLANGRTLSKTAANKGSNRRRLVIVRRGKAYALKRCRTQMAGNAALRERPGAPAEAPPALAKCTITSKWATACAITRPLPPTRSSTSLGTASSTAMYAP